MDPEHIFYIVLALFWFLSQLSSLAKKKPPEEVQPASKKRRPPQPAPVTVEIPALPEREARGTLESLARLEKRVASGLPELDEKSRAAAMALLEHRYDVEGDGVRDSLERALFQKDAGRIYGEIGRAEDLVAVTEEVLKAARRLSALRGQEEVAGPVRVADRLVDEISRPLRAFFATSLQNAGGATAPPVAIVADPGAGDPLRSSPLAGTTIFVPRAVTVDPLHWSLVAHEVSRYLSALTPGLYQEIFDELSLRVTEEDISTSREALTRLLYGAYIVRFVGDVVGASLFGPSYLRALARLYAEPDSPSRVATVYLNEDGTVHPEPPPHLRVHVTAAYLSEMGFATEAREAAMSWDERHGNPASFSFFRSMGTLPADVVLETSKGLTIQIHQLELQSLASRTLAAVPGIGDGAPRRAEWAMAKAAFLQGARASGSARSLLAAAMDAALEAPGAATAIRNALYKSVDPAAVAGKASRARAARREAPAHRRAAGPFDVTGREVAEALILGDVLLERRRF